MAQEALRVVVADDDEVIRRILTLVLTREGFQTVSTASGEETLSAVKARRPDAIVLDAMMPDIDGLEVLHILRGDDATRDIPVMMLSARGLERDMVTGFDSGASDYLVKPFKPEELVARLRRLMAPARQWERDAL